MPNSNARLGYSSTLYGNTYNASWPGASLNRETRGADSMTRRSLASYSASNKYPKSPNCRQGCVAAHVDGKSAKDIILKSSTDFALLTDAPFCDTW